MVQEVKWADLNSSTISLTTTPSIGTVFPDVAQGVGSSNRIGRKLMIDSFNMQFYVRPDSGNPTFAVGSEPMVHIAILADLQPNGALPTFADVFDGGAGTCNFMNLHNTKRFRLLKYWKWYPPVETIWNGTNILRLVKPAMKRFRRSKVQIPMVFSGTTGAVSERTLLNLFYVMWIDNGVNLKDVLLRSRWRFHDS